MKKMRRKATRLVGKPEKKTHHLANQMQATRNEG